MEFRENAKRTVRGMANCLIALSVEKIEKLYKDRNDLYHVIDTVTEQGTILSVEKNNRFYPLNSFYDTQKAAEEWAGQFDRDDINDNSIIIVYGLADGKSVLRLCQKNRIAQSLYMNQVRKSFGDQCITMRWHNLQKKRMYVLL